MIARRPRRLARVAPLLLPLALLAAVAGPAAAQTASPVASTPVMVVLDASSSMKQVDAPGPGSTPPSRPSGTWSARCPTAPGSG